ncbi:MAG: glycine cleavage system aminomethyltransferase GcvT [Desulfovibrionales bacterium]
MNELHKTPLFDWHSKNRARMVPFAGWVMPLQYDSILTEHHHTREKVSVFDICHMGEFLVQGPGARESLSFLLTHDLDTLRPGRCRYGFMLDPKGGVLDDLIVYALDEESYMLVVNGARIDADFSWIHSHLLPETTIKNISEQTAKIDLQGPECLSPLERVLTGDWRIPYFSFRRTQFAGEEILVSRTGYTGELGFELYMPASLAVTVWTALMENPAVRPAGLGARDTLRLEAGLPLYGQDLDEHHTPVEAGYGFMLRKSCNFLGKEKMTRIKERLVGFHIEGKRSARHGDGILLAGNRRQVGRITSGSIAPSLGHCIALGYVDAEFAQEDSYIVAGARTEFTATRTDPPFYSQGTARMKF